MNIDHSKFYRPLPDCLTIENSTIEGLGLFAKCDIKMETNLGISHVFHVDYEDNYIRTPLGGFINYSEKPNCDILYKIGDLYLITKRDIKKGEELTLKYILYDPT
jgi:SET domain-containing protein